jgi:hypothetical protein
LPNDFYIDHTHPFGAAAASSNAGMIANAIVDIWQAEGVKPILKYEDDLKIFRFPVMAGKFHNDGFLYDYNRAEALSAFPLSSYLGTKKKATSLSLTSPISSGFVGIYLTSLLAFLKRSGSSSIIVFAFFWIASQTIVVHCLMSKKSMAHYAMSLSSILRAALVYLLCQIS